MEAFAAFVLGLGMMAAAQDAAYAPYRAGQSYYYAAPAVYADSGYRPAYVYAPVPAPAPAVGAVTGGVIGAAAGGGGAPVGIAPAYAPAAPAHSAEAAESYIRNWQGFVQPSPQR